MLILLFFCMQSVRDRKRRSCCLNINIQRVYLSVSIGLQVCINQYICLSKFENLGWGNKSRLHAIISGDRLFWPVLSYFGSEFVCDWESESSLEFVFCAFQFLLSWTWESQEISWRLHHHNCNPNRAAVGSYPSLFPENKFWPRDLSYFHIPKM